MHSLRWRIAANIAKLPELLRAGLSGAGQPQARF